MQLRHPPVTEDEATRTNPPITIESLDQLEDLQQNFNANFDNNSKVRDDVTTLQATVADLQEWTGQIIKTSDETVTNSAVLQDDDGLQFTVDAPGTYVIELLIKYSGTVALGWNITCSAGTMHAVVRHTGFSSTDTLQDTSVIVFAVTTMAVDVSWGQSATVTRLGRAYITVGFTAANTFKFRWYGGAAASVTVQSGSILRYKALGS